MMKVDFNSVAKTIVTQCMRVTQGETILLSGGLYCWELLEDIAVAIAQQSAFYIISPHTDKLNTRVLTEADPEFLRETPPYMKEIAHLIDGQIGIDQLKDPRALQNVPEERLGARKQASRPIQDILVERKVRWTGMGFPTPEKAKLYGVPYEMFHDVFWKAVDADYKKMYTTGKEIVNTLKDSKVRITTDKTDLEFSLANRPIFIDDGIISEEDISIGDVGNNLPAGEVFCAPVEVSAHGRAFFDAAFYKGKKISGIDIQFNKGKLQDVSCDKNEDLFKDVLKNSHGKKDVIGEFGIGLNPEVKNLTGYTIMDEKIIGSIHIALGENRGFGGTNESSLHWDLVMMCPTIEADGKIIMEEGSFIKEE
jgi:aminopeptidase